ncbi:VP2 [Gyrovirus homsa1]|uniref:Dual specificity protein phosphatase VP2 n=1 Tax=Gyrovirus homsa1 TaxID=2844802 RepID=A0A9E7V3Q1_9VIRU|nr:VP2 [Gyrovirus homsa1]
MSSGGLGDSSENEQLAAGGSELPLRQEGQLGPSGAGSTGKKLKKHDSPYLNGTGTWTPDPKNYRNIQVGDIRASNKFVGVGWDSLQRDPNWARVNYNYRIASWLRECSRTHDAICNCGGFRRHWFQEAAGLSTQETQTDPVARDLDRLVVRGNAAKRKLDYIANRKTPKKKKAKTVTWLDDFAGTEESSDTTDGEDGTGDTDCDEDAIPGGVNFDMRVDDPVLAALKGRYSTHIRDLTW